MSIDIILPCYNPIGDWAERIVREFGDYKAKNQGDEVNLIIVNDGSSEIDQEKVEWLKESIAELKWIDAEVNRGKGAALRRGFEESEADYIVFTDIDFPFVRKSLHDITQTLISSGADIVAGYRTENYYNKTPGERKRISKMLRWVNRNIFRLPVSDTQCGLKAFNQKGRDLFLKTTVDRYLFDLELLILAAHKTNNLSVKPCPVELREEVVFSKLNASIYLTETSNILRLYLRKLFS